jgi:hypothetical protein
MSHETMPITIGLSIQYPLNPTPMLPLTAALTLTGRSLRFNS